MIDNKLNIDLLCKIGFCIIAFGYLIFLASVRYDVGFDYFQYTLAYEDAAGCNSLKELFKLQERYEPGYILFEYLFSRIAPSYEAFLFIHAFIVSILFVIPLIFYSKNIYISAVLYVMLNTYAISLNFSRQIIAMAILFAGFGLLQKKKYLRYALVILLAMSFHLSSAVMFLLLALCFIKPNKYMYLGLFSACMVLALFSSKIIDAFCKVVEKYGYYIDTLYLKMNGSEKEVSIFFILSLLIVIIYFFTSWRSDSENSHLYVKIAFICFILVAFMRKHYIMDRLAYYYIAYYLVVIPDIMQFAGKRSVNILKKLIEKKPGKEIFRYKSFYGLAAFVTAMVLIVFNCCSYYSYSAKYGSHKVYPYETANEGLSEMLRADIDDEQLLKTTQSFMEYLSLLDNEDYIIVGAYNYNWITVFHFNDIFMEKAGPYISRLGLMELFNGMRNEEVKCGGFIIDGGSLVETNYGKVFDYSYNGVDFLSYGNVLKNWINVSDTWFESTGRSMDFVVYSKSKMEIVDYCRVMEGEFLYSPTLYHGDIEIFEEKNLDNGATYLDILMYMLNRSNTIILYNNNEDFAGEALKTSYDGYYSLLGSTITTDALCKQNVAAMRFGGEWREIMYPSSPAQIEANVDGVFYDVYADSYNSYCKINGVEVSSAGTGLNVLIISPEGEILFNGSVDVYSSFNEVTVNDEFAYIPA